MMSTYRGPPSRKIIGMSVTRDSRGPEPSKPLPDYACMTARRSEPSELEEGEIRPNKHDDLVNQAANLLLGLEDGETDQDYALVGVKLEQMRADVALLARREPPRKKRAVGAPNPRRVS
ncbi:MAG: hypothetical protein GY738_03070 [Pseudoalteromonas sp.]|nr:hypothetical protein [Pseudoalteromonas sp.]